MEDDLKIVKDEYLSNLWTDITQICEPKVGRPNQTIQILLWRQPPMEDYQTLKMLQMKKTKDGRWLQMEYYRKILLA